MQAHLSAATTIGLFIIPTLFAVIEWIADWGSRKARREEPTSAQ